MDEGCDSLTDCDYYQQLTGMIRIRDCCDSLMDCNYYQQYESKAMLTLSCDSLTEKIFQRTN